MNSQRWRQALWTWKPTDATGTHAEPELVLETAYRLIAQCAFNVEANAERFRELLPSLEAAGSVSELVRLIADDLVRDIAGRFGAIEDLESKCHHATYLVRRLLKNSVEPRVVDE